MRRIAWIAAALVAFFVTIMLAYRLGTQHATTHDVGTQPAVAPTERKVLYWFDPMVPDKHFDRPGKSPFMDMMLLPKYADEIAQGGVRVDPATTQNLGLRTAEVVVGTLARELRVPGMLAWDRRSAYAVSARADAVIDKLYVRAPFETVKAGQPLAELLAPQWSAAIAEYRALGDAHSSEPQTLRDAARQRLRVLGLSEADIHVSGSRGTAGARIVLRAPADGVVAALDVREGQRVEAGTALMSLNGLDTIWVEAAIPQADIAGIGPGTPVRIGVSALPGQSFIGHVEVLLSEVDNATRTQRARVVIDNPGHRLAPGMFAELRIETAPGVVHPLIPEEALIASGVGARVIVATGEGRYRPVRVRVGRASGGRVEILDGLQGGERVVTSGQFLLDSEASLSGALQRLDISADDDGAKPERKP